MAEESGTTALVLDNVVPLPFRILFSIQLGVYLWYLVVYFCTRHSRLNILQLLNLSYSNHNYSQLDHHLPSTGEFQATIPADRAENQLLIKGIWNANKAIAIYNSLGYFFFMMIQLKYDINNEDTNNIIISFIYHIIPIISLVAIVVKVFCKPNINTKSIGQFRVYTSVKRILLGRINSSTMRTNDILISDTLTSYSKVLNDIGLFLWTYYYSKDPYSIHIEFIILCIPTMIRMKQCWFEYTTTKKVPHLLNMIKYSTALGPLLINLLIKMTLRVLAPNNNEQVEKDDVLPRLNSLNSWWYFFAVLNSTYSFIWDVKMDWGFGLFNFGSAAQKVSNFTLLRPSHQLVYGSIPGYYCIIFIDFVLRYLWVFKLYIIGNTSQETLINKVAAFLFAGDSLSAGYLTVEILEIFRRWLWCFIKLESDWVKLQETSTFEDIELNSVFDKRET